MAEEQEQQEQSGRIIIEFSPDGGHRCKLEGVIPHAMLINAMELLKLQVLSAQMQQAAMQQANKRVIFPGGPLPPNGGFMRQ
jgi:hypothetical protein